MLKLSVWSCLGEPLPLCQLPRCCAQHVEPAVAPGACCTPTELSPSALWDVASSLLVRVAAVVSHLGEMIIVLSSVDTILAVATQRSLFLASRGLGYGINTFGGSRSLNCN